MTYYLLFLLVAIGLAETWRLGVQEKIGPRRCGPMPWCCWRASLGSFPAMLT